MLDAAHGEAVSPIAAVKRIHLIGDEAESARIRIARSRRRRRPTETVRADVRQISRRGVAEARSRRSKQSLE